MRVFFALAAAGLVAGCVTTETVQFQPGPTQQAMIRDGLPGFVAEQIIRTLAQLRQGAGAQVTPTVETLTGSAPRDFASFARAHARLFAPAAATAQR